MCSYRLVPVIRRAQSFELFEVYPVPVLGEHKGYYYSSPDVILLVH